LQAAHYLPHAARSDKGRRTSPAEKRAKKKGANTMTQKTLAKHLDEYTALAQQIAALEAQKQAVADKIKDAMGEAEEVQAGAYTARYKAVTSSRFDARAFQQAHKKLYSAFCRPQTVKRFTVASA
jgi:putative phage-type endonuclease